MVALVARGFNSLTAITALAISETLADAFAACEISFFVVLAVFFAGIFSITFGEALTTPFASLFNNAPLLSARRAAVLTAGVVTLAFTFVAAFTCVFAFTMSIPK